MTWVAIGVEVGGAVVGAAGNIISSRSANKGNAALGRTGQAEYDYGSGLTEEGLGGLRSLDKTYSDRLGDPLGAVGRGIFTRARGALSDDFTRSVNSGDAHAAQLARQSGGTLTPEQVAALDAQNRRGASEDLFQGTGAVANAEATATLSEQGKLFDRLENIRNTITTVGQNEKTRGLQSIISAISAKYASAAATMSAANAGANTAIGGYKAYQAANPPVANPYTGHP